MVINYVKDDFILGMIMDQHSGTDPSGSLKLFVNGIMEGKEMGLE